VAFAVVNSDPEKGFHNHHIRETNGLRLGSREGQATDLATRGDNPSKLTHVMLQDFQNAASLPNVWVVNIPNETQPGCLPLDPPGLARTGPFFGLDKAVRGRPNLVTERNGDKEAKIGPKHLVAHAVCTGRPEP